MGLVEGGVLVSALGVSQVLTVCHVSCALFGGQVVWIVTCTRW